MHVDIVDADEFVIAGRVRCHDADFQQRLMRRRAWQRDGERRHKRGQAWAGGRVGNISPADICECARISDSILHDDLLNSVVGRSVDISRIEREVDRRGVGGIDVEQEIWVIRRRRALHGDDIVAPDIRAGEVAQFAGRDRVGIQWCRVSRWYRDVWRVFPVGHERRDCWVIQITTERG